MFYRNYNLSDFVLIISQRVGLWINNTRPSLILNQNFYNASHFEMKVLQRFRFLYWRNYNESDFELNILERVGFWIKNSTTSLILNQNITKGLFLKWIFYNAADSEFFFSMSQVFKKKTYNESNFELKFLQPVSFHFKVLQRICFWFGKFNKASDFEVKNWHWLWFWIKNTKTCRTLK